jgi:general secretion pathway protein J
MTRPRGFTLVEVLVALAVLAVFATFAWQATASLVDGEARLSAEARRWQRLDAVFARLDADVRAAVPRPIRVAQRREPAFVGTPDAFVFTRAGDASAEAAEGVRIAYRQRGDTLEIAYWPRLDRVAGVEPTAYPLASNIARFELRYVDDDGATFERWPPREGVGLPRALAIGVTLADGLRVDRLVVLR